MRRVVKRGLVGLVAVTAVGGLAVAGAAPAQASAFDVHVDNEDNPFLLRLCLTVKGTPGCVTI